MQDGSCYVWCNQVSEMMDSDLFSEEELDEHIENCSICSYIYDEFNTEGIAQFKILGLNEKESREMIVLINFPDERKYSC